MCLFIIIKIVLMVQHTYTHTMIKEIKRKYKAMTTKQITDKTYSVQIRRMIERDQPSRSEIVCFSIYIPNEV